MDAVNPWLDPSEVRHLAEQLMRPVAPARLAAADPGFDAAFVGFTSQNNEAPQAAPTPVAEQSVEAPAPSQAQEAPTPPPLPETPPPLQAVEISRISEAPKVTDTQTEVVPAPSSALTQDRGFSPTRPERPLKTRFLERVQIFRDWLVKNFQASDVFILDKDGKVIFDESGHGRLHFMARNLAFASRASGSQSGNIHVKIGPAAILEVIPCETPYGRIVLGALVPESLPAVHIETITEVLIQTASPT